MADSNGCSWRYDHGDPLEMGVPQFDYFHWQVKNGCGYGVRLDMDEWLSGQGRLSVIEKF